MRNLRKGHSGHLSDLKVGQIARVTGIHNDSKVVRRRLLDMGITTGVIVTIKKIAPLGDPVDIELRGYELCIRKADMANIDIEVIK
jgi:ferrous iron transport protein B